MKLLKHLAPVLALILVLGSAALFAAPKAAAANGDVKINETNFPDANFRSAVTAYDKNSDGTLSASELKAVTEMRVTSSGISNMKGIEHFTYLKELICTGNVLSELDTGKNTKLTHLYCSGNGLTSLDVSKNTILEILDCSYNELTSLNLANNKALKSLYCYTNPLTSLDVSKNTNLDTLYCFNNQLDSLDISKNTKLQYFDCQGNDLTSLDLSKNTSLIGLECGRNQLTSLDLSKNTKLLNLSCRQNKLESLDVTKCTKLSSLDCTGNQLSSLDVSKNTELTELGCPLNKLSSLDISNNTKLELFSCAMNKITSLDISKNVNLRQFDMHSNQQAFLDISNNPALRCAYIAGKRQEEGGGGIITAVTYIVGRTEEYNDNSIMLTVDPAVDIELFIPVNDTYFPDEGFRYLVANYIDTNEDGFLIASEISAVPGISVFAGGVTTLKGIEVFSAIEDLDCSNNKLTELDVSLNPNLIRLDCSNNQLSSLNIGRNGMLTTLDCYGNNIPVLDLKGARKLVKAVSEGTVDDSDPKYIKYSYKNESDNTLYSLKADRSTIFLPKGNPFIDVPEGKFYYVPVMWAYTRDPQVTGGTSLWNFSPNDTCTRGQVVTFLWRAKGCPEPATTTNPFKDVKSDKYYYKAVLWAIENNITTGTTPTTFSPNDPCTRGQVVTFLWRAMGSPKPQTSKNPFKDVKSDKYYYKAVLWAVENKITTGTSPTTFEPNKTCTRGEVVTFLYRAVGQK